MTLTVCVPVMNQLNDSKPALANLKYMSSDDTEFMIIDNGSSEDYETFVKRYMRPKKLRYIKNQENIGLVKTMQQAYENCETDLLAITHSDVYIYEKDWDKRVVGYFEKIDKLGGLGFFGAQGCGPIGERIQDVPSVNVAAGLSNMLEAEIHGMRLEEEYKPVAIFDGFFMAFSMEMLKKGNGFDQRYIFHHIYDRDISLESLRRGYKNIVVNIPCHHLCGLTANRSEYQTWIREKMGREDADKWTHDENSRLFKDKWIDVLPVYVENDFSYRSGADTVWTFKGDNIVNCKTK